MMRGVWAVAHCAEPILRAGEYGLVRTCTDEYGLGHKMRVSHVL